MDIGILLAAGRSTRFGPENKLLAPVRGCPLLAHAAGAMRAVPLARRLAVVGDPALDALLDGFDLLRPPSGEGQAASVTLAVATAARMGARRVLIALGDMPDVDGALMHEVLARCGARGACATDGTRRTPPAAFPAARFGALLALSGDAGAGRLLRDLPDDACIAVPAAHLADIDTPADLRRVDSTGA